MDAELRARAEAWMAEDPDPATRQELGRLLDKKDEDELRERFAQRLEFGTAGLRGLLGAGPNRMNRSVVIRTTAGLCAYLKEHFPDAPERGVCIGFDARRMSRAFAWDVAHIVAGAGFKVKMFERVVPTPLLAFACASEKAAAGVMITASHNPPKYNGYKVYLAGGAQIVPPTDAAISREIDKIGLLEGIARLGPREAKDRGLFQTLGRRMEERYLDGIQSLLVHPERKEEVSIAYTALHGVGQAPTLAALRRAGFKNVHPVSEQATPDPDFPTVDFPNPEEPGAMDQVVALAERQELDIALANDPDADRLAVAARGRDGKYTMLTGNEVGCLFAHYLLSEGPRSSSRLVISTVVSSPMLGVIAEAHKARWEQTLTGFKWIAARARELERSEGYRFVCGYEEALGYALGTHVRDKDGISAATVMADMARWCRSQGRTLLDEREVCWRRYGMYLSRQLAVTHEGQEGLARIANLMTEARRKPPNHIGNHDVTAVWDLLTGTVTPRHGTPTKRDLPPSNTLVFELGPHRAMMRPSGTEPKLKYYFDVRVDLTDDGSVEDARARGEELLDHLAKELLILVG